jgi:hypothetical protein
MAWICIFNIKSLFGDLMFLKKGTYATPRETDIVVFFYQIERGSSSLPRSLFAAAIFF